MREILFRGQGEDKNWYYGFYREFPQPHDKKNYFIDDSNGISYFVIPETVGQFTGLTDKNGTKIFENDIVLCWGGEYCQGYWEHDSNITVLDAYSIVEMSESENIEIIKDIHDNPNLLGGDNS